MEYLINFEQFEKKETEDLLITFESYNKPRSGGKKRWSVKYKRSINCSNPKGFSQRQFCARKRRGGSYKSK